MKLLLFDIDGTILLTDGAGGRAMLQAARRMFGPEFSFDGISFAGRLDPDIILEACGRQGARLTDTEHRAFRRAYAETLETELALPTTNSRVLPGVKDLLEQLRHRTDVTLGMLTGNYAHTGPIKLQSVGIDPAWFTVRAFGDEAEDRPALVRVALARYAATQGGAIATRDVIVIGDTPLDVECAHVNGCQCLAVATGSFSEHDLRAAGAERVARDLSDPAPLLRMIEGEKVSG